MQIIIRTELIALKNKNNIQFPFIILYQLARLITMFMISERDVI